jgi:dephospho-CoA kinase
MKIFIVGLTGGIGSGKSTVAQDFERLGAATIDADDIARSLTIADGHAMPIIEREFGREVIGSDGALDRSAMRVLAFADSEVKRRLEEILHPMIRQQFQQRVVLAATEGAPYVILELPLLFEGMSYRNVLSRILVIDCPIALQIDRVRERSQLSGVEVAEIVAAQIPRPVRLQLADDVIENTKDLDDLTKAVALLHAKYLALAVSARLVGGIKYHADL